MSPLYHSTFPVTVSRRTQNFAAFTSGCRGFRRWAVRCHRQYRLLYEPSKWWQLFRSAVASL